MMARNILLVAIGWLAGWGNAMASPGDTLRVLFVGNSYTYYNNLIQMVSLLSDATPTKLVCTKSTVGGTNLREHWDEQKGLKSRSLIRENRYDAVVLQDHSMRAIEQPDSLLDYGRRFCGLIRATGARTLIYSTWSRKATPDTQDSINHVYARLTADCNGLAVMVGSCWREYLRQDPGAELYAKDGSHPSHLGTFIAAMAFTRALCGRMPGEIPTVFNYFDRDGETFRIMQVTPEEIRLTKAVADRILSPTSGN